MAKYTVYVDDNYHFMDESERVNAGVFDSAEEAIAKCKKIVDEYFTRIKPGEHSYAEIWSGYQTYGEDPFVISGGAKVDFSAWDYAKERARELSRKE